MPHARGYDRGVGELDGRVALVTGAGRGIGRAAALALSREGARVVGVSRSADELASLHEECGALGVTVALDDPAGCRAAVDAARELGPVQILVNNAGIGSANDAAAWQIEPESWHATHAINLHAPFELARLVLPDMIAAGWGRVVSVSSTSGERSGPGESAYSSSKHALIGLARSLAIDAAPNGVTSNAVCPGWVRTEMAERSARATAAERGIGVDEVWAERAAGYPEGRVLAPEEVAEVIAFLCSPRASGVNGQAITVALGGVW
jgi:NAD(P)-dependent dehydrogenase (short-subunit alcohol dehydrogenase family)